MTDKRKRFGSGVVGNPVWFAVGKGVAVGGTIAWLFYESVIGLVCAPVCIAIMILQERKKHRLRQQEKEQEYFVEYLGFLREALLAGYSLEQAVGEGRKGMQRTLKGKDAFLRALLQLERKLQLGISVEAAFAEWAKEAHCEEIREFSEVLFIAKRTGGAVQKVIENTEHVIREKQETLRYIRSLLHSREYEAGVMKVMPFAMLLYLRVFMSEFLAPLYHNPVGIGIMTAVLSVYAVLCFVTDKITEVSV